MTTKPVSNDVSEREKLNMEHSKEPWGYVDHGVSELVVFSKEQDCVALLDGQDETYTWRPLKQREVDARRIVACVNACTGISTEKLESDYKQGYEPWSHVEHLRAATAQQAETIASMQRTIDELTEALNVADYYLDNQAMILPLGSRKEAIEAVKSALAKVKAMQDKDVKK